ncbi:MAG: hypothetical protein AB8F34_02280 [Akkermansiaceae bacterium]
MTSTLTGLDGAHELLIKLVDQAPDDWAMRKKVAKVLFDARYYRDASQMIWSAPEIPPTGEDIVFSTKIVAKGQPTRAMRLINTVIEKNLGSPEENLLLAKLFVKSDMPLQAIRCYGAALALDASLIDERFEISLLNADVESLPWVDEVMGEDFPWDGPQMDEENENDDQPEDVHAELLNGLTQPVPIRALMSQVNKQETKANTKKSETKPEFKDEPEAETNTETATKTVEESEPEPVSQEGPKRELPTWKVQEGRATFDPNKKAEAKLAENDLSGQDDTTDTFEELSKIAEVEQAIETKVEKVVNNEVIEPPQAESLPELKVETAAVTESTAREVFAAEVPKEETSAVAQPAFFKSYDDAHEHKDEVIESFETVDAEDIRAIAEKVDTEEPDNVFQIDAAQPIGDDLDDYVADAMAEYESSAKEEEKPRENGVVGALSSLVSRFCKKKSEITEDGIDLLDENEPEGRQPEPVVEVEEFKTQDAQSEQQHAAIAEVPSPPPVPVPVQQVPAPAAEEAVSKAVADTTPSPLDRPGVHTSAQKLVTQSQPEPEQPKELDGRTQLVALAPEDGTPFFEQLITKYQNVPEGQTPRAVVVARDMANADYLKLIHQACAKDLDSFSKLLGLHRVMASNNCGDWGEDMNLLRKGYGDAVLATVVSKYSVSECREILNSVYQHPASAAVV